MSKKSLIDVAERASMTFVQAFFAIIIARQTIDSLALKAGAIAGGLSVAKGFAATKVGSKDSAGLIS